MSEKREASLNMEMTGEAAEWGVWKPFLGGDKAPLEAGQSGAALRGRHCSFRMCRPSLVGGQILEGWHWHERAGWRACFVTYRYVVCTQLLLHLTALCE